MRSRTRAKRLSGCVKGGRWVYSKVNRFLVPFTSGTVYSPTVCPQSRDRVNVLYKYIYHHRYYYYSHLLVVVV